MPDRPSRAGAPPVHVVRMDSDADAGAWDAYVGSRSSTVTDLFAWRRVVRDAYGIRAHFLAAREDARVVGTLGLFEIAHPIFGHYMTTAVFGNDGGFFHDHEAARDALIAEAQRVAREARVAYVALRSRTSTFEAFADDPHYRTAVIDLGGGPEAVWKRLPAKTRNQVRRGQKEGFTVARGPEEIDAFHDVFHRHMRALGSPGHGLPFYHAIQRHLGDQAEFVVVRDGSSVVGGALMFRYNGMATNYHAVSLRQYNRRCPNYLLYWDMIEQSCALQCAAFDMGRSRADSTNMKFKQNWNPQVLPLHYNYWLCRARHLPDLNPGNPAFRVQIAMWRRMPLFVTRRLGPHLISGLA